MSNIFLNRLILLLLAINSIAGLTWIFGFHTLRLVVLFCTGFILLLISMVKFNRGTNFSKLFVIFIIILSLLRNYNQKNLPNILTDLSTLGLIFSVAHLNRFSTEYITKVIFLLFVISAMYFMYTLPFMDLTFLLAKDVDRLQAFNSFDDKVLNVGVSFGYIIYATQQLSVAYLVLVFILIPLVIPYLKKKYILSIIAISAIIIIIYSAFYQKRQPITEIGILIFLNLIFNRRNLRGYLPKNFLLSIISVSILTLLILATGIFDNTFDRYTKSLENVESFDRLEESVYVLSQFNWIEWLIGKGLGYSAPNTAGGTILHIGYSNLIMKGGVLLLLLYFIQVFVNLRFCFKMRKRFDEYNIGLVISCFSILQLLFAPGYHWYVTTTITGLAMFSRYPLTSFIYAKYNYTCPKRG